MTIRACFQIASWLALLVIVALSLVAPSLRPVTFLPQALEHAAIFGLAGIAAGLGYPSRTALTLTALVTFSAAVEVAQLFVPGRHARLRDFAVDAGAALIGVALAGLAARMLAKVSPAASPRAASTAICLVPGTVRTETSVPHRVAVRPHSDARRAPRAPRVPQSRSQSGSY
jgi:VanZ family protein